MKYEYVCLVSATVLLFDIFYCTFWLLDINKNLKSTNKTKAMLNIENLFKYSIDVKSLVYILIVFLTDRHPDARVRKY